MRFRPIAFLFVVLAVVIGPALAAPNDDARAAIEAVYAKMATAARWKYVDGMMSGRAPDFTATAPNGQTVNLDNERATLARLMTAAITVKETTSVVDLSRVDADHAVCRVHDVMTLVLDKADNDHPLATQTLTVDTTSEDHWVKTASGWLLSSSHVLTQTPQTAPGPEM
jgi:hypothetical protein